MIASRRMSGTTAPFVTRLACGLPLALLAACAPARDAAPTAEAKPGPRYVCEYDPDPRNMTDCDLESKVVPEMGGGGMMRMLEVSRFPGVEPTPAQKQAAEEMVKRCYAAAEKHGWYDFAKATADGFKLKVSDDTHYNNIDNLFDDRVLDPDRPEYLMYYDSPDGKVLAGFMFVPRSNTEEGPQFGGPLTRWHYHTWGSPICLVKGIYDTGAPVDGKCDMGAPSYRSPEMLHVWLLDHPQGPFATGMGLSDALIDRLLRERRARTTTAAH
ncbi:MAG TPA: hypothetical protein VJV75_04015 [Candidatus Polarisedimenticolia bacterium]|nr:hypothetical protein [Candidatus Polarisedimenticolia bacterium]